MFRVLAFGDSLTNGFHSDDKSYTPYAQTLEYLLNKDVHRCYTLTTIAKDGTEAAEMSTRLQNHLRDGTCFCVILVRRCFITHRTSPLTRACLRG